MHMMYTTVYYSVFPGQQCTWQTSVFPIRHPRHRWMFPCCTHFSCRTDIQTGRKGSGRWVWMFFHVEYMLVYVFFTQQAAEFWTFSSYLTFLSCSGGVWPWRKSSYYWRTDPYVSWVALPSSFWLEIGAVISIFFLENAADVQHRFNSCYLKILWIYLHETTVGVQCTCSLWMVKCSRVHVVL